MATATGMRSEIPSVPDMDLSSDRTTVQAMESGSVSSMVGAKVAASELMSASEKAPAWVLGSASASEPTMAQD